MRRLALLTFLFAAAALAEEPSFSCQEASTPVELLICGDNELIRLDGLVKKLPQGQQGDWLKKGMERCGIAAKGSYVDERQQWVWAPCLAERYRERLAALGVTEPPPAAAPAGVIHPLCVLRAIGAPMGDGDGRPTNVAACAKGFRHVPVEAGQGGWFTSWLGGVNPQSMGYRVVGPLAGGEAIEILYRTDLTELGAIYRLRRKGEVVTGDFVAGGGDRCNNGVAAVQLIEGKTVRLTAKTTAQDFVKPSRDCPIVPSAATAG